MITEVQRYCFYLDCASFTCMFNNICVRRKIFLEKGFVEPQKYYTFVARFSENIVFY